ncbi:MAG: PAS domain-containing sensor histidine kinase [Chloroflexi bacterium]|nr:PAS domain-containing sensor histidine kinase [Chloroflexota bacterium]
MSERNAYDQLLLERDSLQARLSEAEETLRAIRGGEVDAIVVSTAQGNRVFTLQSADQPYRLLVEQMHQGAVTTSTDGILLYCNQCFAEALGTVPEAITSLSIEEYLVAADREPFKAFLQKIPSTSTSNQEFCFQGPSGESVPMYVSANLLLLDQAQVICMILTDLRERKRAEEQALALEIEQQRIKLLAAFIRDTSHDLRTPIATILTGLHNLERMKDEPERAEKIRLIQQYVIYLNGVLEQLQHMAMLDALASLPLREGHINPIIADAIAHFGRPANHKNIPIVTELAPHPPPVRFDPDTLYRAFGELIKNAVRFTPSGGHIRIRSAVEPNGSLVVEITDNGVGISPDKLPHVFERFFKADEARSMAGGAGLGLAMAKRIIEMHDGTIAVESIPGERTSFRVALPVTASV